MKQLLDFLPLIVFFVFYKLYNIYIASAALVIATGLALAIVWLKYKKVEKMTLVTFIMVAIFGSLTYIFHNDLFIKWKVTLIYGLFAIALLISQWVTRKPIIQQLLGKEVSLPDTIWRHLNLAWAMFFIICALLNIYVAFWLPENSWVNFKVFGLTAATFVFTLLSIVYIYRHLPKQDQ